MATQNQIQYPMKQSYKTIITAAAIAGLYLGAMAAKSYAADAGSTAPTTEKAKDSCKGKDGCKAKDGKDSCKGKAGCSGKSEGKAHDCKGKNECKGKGGCNMRDCTASADASAKP